MRGLVLTNQLRSRGIGLRRRGGSGVARPASWMIRSGLDGTCLPTVVRQSCALRRFVIMGCARRRVREQVPSGAVPDIRNIEVAGLKKRESVSGTQREWVQPQARLCDSEKIVAGGDGYVIGPSCEALADALRSHRREAWTRAEHTRGARGGSPFCDCVLGTHNKPREG